MVTRELAGVQVGTVGRAAVAIALVVTMVLGLDSCSAGSHVVTVNGRTLLTHQTTGASADALKSGVVGSNAHGCVTLGTSVLVVPDGSTLATDGSVTVLGKTYTAGTVVSIGGGVGEVPIGSTCGSHAKYFWVG
jgi:hypothetical protein